MPLILAALRMPAVSTKRKRPSAVSTLVSMASRVVPATSLTSTRGSPTIALKRLDLPALGRPTMATGISLSAAACGASWSGSGNSATARSSRSPVPRPCAADTQTGSPRPSSYSSGAGAAAGSSSLLATSKQGTRWRRTSSAMEKSSPRGPARPSTRKRTTSAAAKAARTCSRMPAAYGDSSPVSKPPVSTSRKARPAQSVSTSLRSLVTPGVACTTALREPLRRFTRVDLPALGEPMTTIVGALLTRPV